MSEFDIVERSRDQGRPFELYLFTYGSGAERTYRYTNADRAVVHDGLTFQPTPIYRDAYRASGKTDKATVNIKLPVKTDLAALFLSYPPTQPVGVRIIQGHWQLSQEKWKVAWMGRILSSSREGAEAVLTCESTIVSMKRPGLRRHYQYACPYVLYGAGCNASQVAATRTATIAEIVNGGLVFEPGWTGGSPITAFANGILRWNSDLGLEWRAILKAHEDNRIEFIGPIRDLDVGSQVNVILGCNRMMDHCRSLHNNIQNFGGQPWIPLKNPTKYHPFW